MSVVIDSNAPYFTEFPLKSAGDAVYMTAEDDILGHVFAIVYRAHHGVPKLSVILIGAHGTSGYVDMTLDRTSRYFGACRGLAPSHYKSPVRRALAIAVLRTYATVDKPLRERLRGVCDESAAGALGSKFRLVYGKYPGAIGGRVLDAGLISPKRIESTIVDIVYEDSDLTIDQNNKLVYLLGEQLEQLFDPLSEYSPEPTERLYTPPTENNNDEAVGKVERSLDNETKEIQDICEELYLLQAHARSDILDLLQTTLIPLRIEVLKGKFPGLTIARLNSVFPPTIDELFRVNNIFYESLRTALPFGAFEVVKACGTTIPYFFRACMRHEAATQNFHQSLAELVADVPEVKEYITRALDNDKIEKIIRNPLHLSSIKSVLERLVNAKKWSSLEERKQIDEFYSVAVGTVDAFARGEKETTSAANKRKSNGEQNQPTLAGAILGEITQDWPAELEYGWINRRVVSVFDAVDVLEPNESLRQLHTVFIVFTDSVVVCTPSEPIPATSLSGLHIPSIGDMLMHALLNEAPLDKNLPPLKVIAWAPILDVHFASYNPQHLYVFSPGIVGSYRLLQPHSDANNLVTLLAKAKITTKTQPFHLFKTVSRETTIYSTVQELQGYRDEINRTNIALFLSTPVNERTLNEYGLVGALSLQLKEDGETVKATVVSKMRYAGSFEVPKDDIQELVVSELSYLMTLGLSSQNKTMLDIILASNRLVVNRLIKWASQPDAESGIRGHKGKHGLGISANGASDKKKVVNDEEDENEMLKDKSASRIFVIPSESADSITPVNRSLRKINGQIPPNSRDLQRTPLDEEPKELDRDPSIDNENELFYSSYSLSSQLAYSSDANGSKSSGSMNDISLEEAEQRDVDNWYHQLHNSRRDDESLSSGLSDADIGSIAFQRSNSNSSSIQLGKFLEGSASNLYNKNAGRAFPRIESDSNFGAPMKNGNSAMESRYGSSRFGSSKTGSSRYGSSRFDSASSEAAAGVTTTEAHRRKETESSFETITSLQDSIGTADDSTVSGNTTLSSNPEDEDFSYLASLVDATSFSSKMSELERGGVYPDLRESSLVRLGSYILRSDKSQRDMPNISLGPINESERNPASDDLGEPTPTLHSDKFSAAPPTPLRDENAGSFTPFADVEMTDWHPKPVKSGTVATLSGLLPRVNRYADRFSDRGVQTVDEGADESFDDEDGNELAKRYLAWAESSGRPVSMLSTKTMNEFIINDAASKAESPKKYPRKREVPISKSQMSFRRMVMSSSLHTLQLASFVVQVDQKEFTSSDTLVNYLQQLKEFVTSIYRMRNITIETEKSVRQKLCGYYLLLMKFDCQQLAYGLLEIEWFRRSRISELRPELIPKLWAF